MNPFLNSLVVYGVRERLRIGGVVIRRIARRIVTSPARHKPRPLQAPPITSPDRKGGGNTRVQVFTPVFTPALTPAPWGLRACNNFPSPPVTSPRSEMSDAGSTGRKSPKDNSINLSKCDQARCLMGHLPHPKRPASDSIHDSIEYPVARLDKQNLLVVALFGETNQTEFNHLGKVSRFCGRFAP